MSESENLAQTLVWNVNTLTRMFHCLEMFLEDVVNFFLYDDVEGWVIASSCLSGSATGAAAVAPASPASPVPPMCGGIN